MKMKEMLRIVGIALLGVFAFIVGLPLVLAAAGIVLQTIGFAFGIAGSLVKLAVALAVVYLVLVGVRAVVKSRA